jgi:hypothetical protein
VETVAETAVPSTEVDGAESDAVGASFTEATVTSTMALAHCVADWPRVMPLSQTS